MKHIDFKKLSVLLVEDDKIAREQLEEFLNDEFKIVYATSNAVEGFDIFEEKSPEIVITDIQMEEMNGIELARAIKGISPNTILVVISAFCNDEYKQAAKDIDVDAYLTKPLNLETLLEKIEQNASIKDCGTSSSGNYVRYLLDSYPKSAVEITSKEISYINKNLLYMFGKDSIADFFAEYEHFGDLFYKENGDRFEEHARVNYIRFLVDDIDKTKRVFAKKDGKLRRLLLTKHEFLSGDKVIVDLEWIE
ncbi:MAG: response regulator transcription factor [Campylobacterales bacterium]